MGSYAPPQPTGIQTIDISILIQSTDPVARKAKADELVEAIRTHGACGIVGHGIPIPHIREVCTTHFDQYLYYNKSGVDCSL